MGDLNAAGGHRGAAVTVAAPRDVPAVHHGATISLYLGTVTTTALQRSLVQGASADCVCAISAVRSPALANVDRASWTRDTAPLIKRAMMAIGKLHSKALVGIAGLVEALEQHAEATDSGTPDGVALGGVAAVGGAVLLSSSRPLPRVEGGIALAGLHMCDGDVSAAEAESVVDEVVMGGELAPVVAARPVYLTRVRYETSEPAFDQWIRLRMSALTSSTVLVFTIFDVRLPDTPMPLATGILPVGRAASVTSTVRAALAPPAASPVTRHRTMSSSSSDDSEYDDIRLLESMLRVAVAPVGLLHGAAFVFSHTQVPLGTSGTAAAEAALLGIATRPTAFDDAPIDEDEAPEDVLRGRTNGAQHLARSHSMTAINSVAAALQRAFHGSKQFARRDDVTLLVYDRSGRLVSAAVAAASYVAAEQARERTFAPIQLRDAATTTTSGGGARIIQRTPSMVMDMHVSSDAVLSLMWRVDVDVDPAAVRGALVLRSVGVTSSHPLAGLPARYLRRLGRACMPGAPRFADIASVLPVLEPLFRFMSGELIRQDFGGGSSGKRATLQRVKEDDPASDDEADESGLTGLDERVFVGICAHCTTLSERVLRVGFRQLDANGDGALLWEEYISYISRLLDNDLGKRAAQGTYLLIQPPNKPTAARGAGSIVDPFAAATATPTTKALAALSSSVIAKAVAAVTSRSSAITGMPDADAPSAQASAGVAAIAGVKQPSGTELMRSVEPARVVKADSEGVAHISVLSELQGYAIAFRNHTMQILDDGLREAVQLDLHSGLNLISDILPPELLSDMSPTARADLLSSVSTDATGEALSRKMVPIVAIDWLGDTACVLGVVCADRRIRIFELSRYVSSGPLPLKEVIQRRVSAEAVRMNNDYRKNLQTVLLAESVRHRKAGLSELLRGALDGRADIGQDPAARSLRRRRSFLEAIADPVAQAMRATDLDKMDADAFVMQAEMSVNVTGYTSSYRDDDEPPQRAISVSGRRGRPGRRGVGMLATDAAAAAPSRRARSGSPRPATSAAGVTTLNQGGLTSLLNPGRTHLRLRGTTGELEDVIDYGRGKDYLRLRSSKATGLSIALGGTGAHAKEIELGGADEELPVTATQRKLRQLTFATDNNRNVDPRLAAVNAASKGDAARFRRVGGRVSSIQAISPSSFSVCRTLSEGMPTALKLVSLRVYGRHNAGWDPALAASAISSSTATLRPGRRAMLGATAAAGGNGGDPPPVTAGATGSSSIIAAIIGDNRGFISAQRLTLVALSSSSPQSNASGPVVSLKLPMESVSCIVALPARSDADTSGGAASDGIVLSSSSATLVVGGHAGPVCILSVAMGFNRSRLLASTNGGTSGTASGGATFRILVTRTLQSTGALAHPHGVTSMAYCISERCLITTGVDRRVLLWNVTDTARSDAQIGQLGTAGAIASDRDAITGLAVNDTHNMILSVSRGGKLEMFDPRTLVCVQTIHDDDVAVFTKGVVVDPIHLSVVTYGSHIRLWNIREAFLNNTNAAIAVARAMAHSNAAAGEASVAEASPQPSAAAPDAAASGAVADITASLGADGSGRSRNASVDATAEAAAANRAAKALIPRAPALLYPVPHDADVITIMGATPWRAVADGYLWEGAAIPRLPPTRSNSVDMDMRKRSDSLVAVAGMRAFVTAAQSRAQTRLKERADAEVANAERRARRSSAVSVEINTIATLREALGGRFVRRGSIEAKLISNMLEELHKHGRSENEEADDDDDHGGGAVGSADGAGAMQISLATDGRTLLCALFSAVFSQIVSVARDGLVRVHDATSGRMVLSFVADHASSDDLSRFGGTGRFIPAPAALGSTPVSLSCAALDTRHRRLITGSVHGSVRVWNLSNGSLLRNLIGAPHGSEVTCATYHPAQDLLRPIIAGLSSARLGFWLDQGRVSDDTEGSGASITRNADLTPAAANAGTHSMRANAGRNVLVLKRAAEEEERLLSLHVRVREASADIFEGSAGSPAAMLRSRTRAHGASLRRSTGDASGVPPTSAPAPTGSGIGGGARMGMATLMRARSSAAAMVASSMDDDDFKLLFTADKNLRPTSPRPASPQRGLTQGSSRTVASMSSHMLRRAASQGTRVVRGGHAEAVPVEAALPSRLEPNVIDALTSPRYLSTEARKLISRARADAAEEHGVLLRPRTAASPRAIQKKHPVPPGGRPHTRGQDGRRRGKWLLESEEPRTQPADEELFSVLDDPRLDAREEFAQAADSAAGIIAVYGGDGTRVGREKGAATAPSSGEGDAKLKPVGVTSSSTVVDAIQQEAIASYQRLAPDIVHVPEVPVIADGELDAPPASARSNASSARDIVPLASGNSSTGRTRVVNVRADVVAVVAGGGQPVDTDMPSHAQPPTAGGSRLAPWAVSCSADGTLALFNPTTERPDACVQLYDTDIVTGAQSPANITAACAVHNAGVTVVGTLTGCLHVFDIGSVRLMKAGMPDHLRASGGHAHTSEAAAAAAATSFITLPASDEWNLVRRGASAVVSVQVPTPAAASAMGSHSTTMTASSPHKHTRRASLSRTVLVAVRGVTCFACSRAQDRMLVGYEGGFARVFDTSSIHAEPARVFAAPVVEWRPHLSRHGITAAEVLHAASGDFWITAGGFDVKIWSLDGHFVALVGQAMAWPTALRGPNAGGASAEAENANAIIQGLQSEGAGAGGTASELPPEEEHDTALMFGWMRGRGASAAATGRPRDGHATSTAAVSTTVSSSLTLRGSRTRASIVPSSPSGPRSPGRSMSNASTFDVTAASPAAQPPASASPVAARAPALGSPSYSRASTSLTSALQHTVSIDVYERRGSAAHIAAARRHSVVSQLDESALADAGRPPTPPHSRHAAPRVVERSMEQASAAAAKNAATTPVRPLTESRRAAVRAARPLRRAGTGTRSTTAEGAPSGARTSGAGGAVSRVGFAATADVPTPVPSPRRIGTSFGLLAEQARELAVLTRPDASTRAASAVSGHTAGSSTEGGRRSSSAHERAASGMSLAASDADADALQEDGEVMPTVHGLREEVATRASSRASRASEIKEATKALPDYARNPFKYMGAGKWQASRIAPAKWEDGGMV